ncbi:Protein of uncharacterised function (DUF2628) [Rhodococcus gordoniae]|uniref:Protein of uncharacterized function (DUF2628) n=1 Tax=Rhodococcus gordoniae TaxID=223392 RepID=A0A379M4C3_9NOCA|nr:DUF2628 domain-containing protein [Rhodococcus gordoniae]SUE16245.1 Protein of uncharacterised function (DUF2628) [Rhodococcus gordoniae]
MTDLSMPAAGSDRFEGLSETWRFRFGFFAAYGTPGLTKTSPEYTAAFRALPMRQRMKLNMNLLGFLFGIFYLLYLRLWKKALVVFGVGIVLGVLTAALALPSAVDTTLTFGLWIFVASRVNVYHYENRVLGRQTWSL